MQRLTALNPEKTSGKSKELFDAVQKKLGMVPNMMRTMGNSPAVLGGYLSLSGALAEGSISAGLGEQIALTVANVNQCNYCNSAHSFISEKLVGLDLDVIADAREGKARSAKEQAALAFARTLVATHGQVSDDDVNSLKDEGFSEGAIAEIIAHVALNIFTNYFNNSARVEVDFPEVDLVSSAAL